MYLNIFFLLLHLFKYSVQYNFNLESNELKNEWSSENNYSSVSTILNYIPKFQLNTLKNRKLRRFDGNSFSYDELFKQLNFSIKQNRISEKFESDFLKYYILNNNKSDVTPNSGLIPYSKTRKSVIYYVNPITTFNSSSLSSNSVRDKDEHQNEINRLKLEYQRLRGKKRKAKDKKKNSGIKDERTDSIGTGVDALYEVVNNSPKRPKKRPNKNSSNLKPYELDVVTQLEHPQTLTKSPFSISTITKPPQTVKMKNESTIHQSSFHRKTKKKISKRSIVTPQYPKFGPTNNTKPARIYKIYSSNQISTTTRNYERIETRNQTNPANKVKPLPVKKNDEYDDYFLDFEDLYEDDSSIEEDDYRIQNKIKKPRRKPNKKLRKDNYGFIDYIYSFVKPIGEIITNLMADTVELTESIDDQITTSTKKTTDPEIPVYTHVEINANKTTGHLKGSSVGSWISSWLGYDEIEESNKLTIATTEEPGWFDSIFGDDDEESSKPSTGENEDAGSWFFNIFHSKPTAKITTTTMRTTLTTEPIVISTPGIMLDPVKNPQKFIEILAQHIANSTAKPKIHFDQQNEEKKIINYDKYQIIRLKLAKEEHVEAMREYKASEEGTRLKWLKGPSLRGSTDILVPPKLLYDVQGTLNFEGIPYEVLMFDLGKAILYESTKDNATFSSKITQYHMNWTKYHSYDNILRFIEDIHRRNPSLITVHHIGPSYEGRPLVIVKIEYKTKNVDKRKRKAKNKNQGVFILGGVHAREWIVPAATTWMIREIVKSMKQNGTNIEVDFIRNKTWYIMPMLNPDGYEYSREFDRMWMKSRSKVNPMKGGLLDSALTWFQAPKLKKQCYGVDLDRNWDYQWSKSDSSRSPCNDNFVGASSFSEPETRSVSRFLMDHRKYIKIFASLHAYGQVISFPNKFNASYDSQKLDDLTDVAMVGVDGLRKSGSSARFRIDSTNDIVPIKGGSADQFAMFEAGIPFSYTIHMGDSGVHGYLLPGSFIESAARDTFEIIKAMVDYV